MTIAAIPLADAAATERLGARRITFTDSGAGRRAEISGDADWKGRILAARLIDHDDND